MSYEDFNPKIVPRQGALNGGRKVSGHVILGIGGEGGFERTE